MRYKNKKTGCVANVRDGKPMNGDWARIGGEGRSATERNDGGKGETGTPDSTWKNDAIDEYAAGLGIDTAKMKKDDKLEAIKAASE